MCIYVLAFPTPNCVCWFPFSYAATAKIQEPKKKNTRLVVAFGSSVRQICRARGNPTPGIEWRKIINSDSKVISLGVGNHSASLLIHSVDENDEGNYSCVARQGHKHADQLFVQIKLGESETFLWPYSFKPSCPFSNL